MKNKFYVTIQEAFRVLKSQIFNVLRAVFLLNNYFNQFFSLFEGIYIKLAKNFEKTKISYIGKCMIFEIGYSFD